MHHDQLQWTCCLNSICHALDGVLLQVVVGRPSNSAAAKETAPSM